MKKYGGKLSHRVRLILEQGVQSRENPRAKSIREAIKIFDDLIDRGLIDPPSYKLDSMNSMPTKDLMFGQQKEKELTIF
jgi:hypothetical protein